MALFLFNRLHAPSLACALLVALMTATGCKNMMSQGQNTEGSRMFAQGDYEAARHRFLQAMATNPEDADSYYNLAVLYHRTGNLYQRPEELQQAERYYRQCLDKNKDHIDCHRGLTVLLVEQGRSEEAFASLEKWVETSPSLAEARVELARLYEEFGDPETAKQQLVTALGYDPNNSRALAALGHLYENAGDPMQALTNYQRSLAANNLQPELARRIAALRTTLGSSPPPAANSAVVTAGQARTVNAATTQPK